MWASHPTSACKVGGTLTARVLASLARSRVPNEGRARETAAGGRGRRATACVRASQRWRA
eukprot:6001562-Pleurochrysis_carterae.AAC.1